MDLDAIRARCSQPITELVANPREYYRVQQILRDRVDLLTEVDRLRGFWTGDKLTGGSHVCHTCQAHIVVIEDGLREIEELKSLLSIAFSAIRTRHTPPRDWFPRTAVSLGLRKSTDPPYQWSPDSATEQQEKT